MNWHYVEEGRQVGPVSDEALADLNRVGRIDANTLVWSEGMADWQPLHAVKLELPPPKLPAVSSEAKPVPAVDASGQATEAVCAECGKLFPIEETIRHGNVRICAGCKPVFLQKLSEGARVNTGELNYAGFGVRFGAKFLDGLIIGLPMMVILVLAMVPAISAAGRSSQPETSLAVQLLPMLIQVGFIFVQLAYQTFFVGKFGATPGKMICKLRIVTADGNRFGYGRAAGRALAEMLSGMICYIGYLMVLFDGQKRALHDHICNTRVIHRQP